MPGPTLKRRDEAEPAGSNRPTPSATRHSYTQFQFKVFRAVVQSTVVFSTLMTIVEAVVRGPWAVQTLGVGAMAVLFSGLALRLRPSRSIRLDTVLGMVAYFSVLLALEHVSTVPAIGIRCVTFIIPVAVVLLVGRAPSLVFYALAAGWAVWMTPLEGEHAPSHILQTVTAIFSGAILLGMAWAFDRARTEAMSLAEARERELRDALQRAEDAAAARTKFLSNMSHEIRTPMNGVLGLSRLMVDEASTPSMQELAQTVVSSGQSLLHILDDILDLSKLDAGALLIDPQPVNPLVIARQTVALMQGTAQEKALRLQLDVDGHLPERVVVDGHRVRQVLTNLVGNALKFTSAGGVTLRVCYTSGELRCRIEDTGIGIRDDVLGQLFQPFQQADSSTARKFGGTGLGLAICKRLCELMEGRIGAESTIGKGSVFWFAIPAPVTAESGEVAQADDDQCSLEDLRVLVAEDNHVNQLVVRKILERCGAQAIIVDDGASAVASLERETYDVVLMDRHMPNLDGLEATRRIRQMAGDRARTPIVALTASVMVGDRQDCLAAGMDAVLAKPIEVEMLQKTLRAYARR